MSFDINVRPLATHRDEHATLTFDIPATGPYIVRIGSQPPRKVVAIK